MKRVGILALGSCLVWGQQSDEVRVSAHPYTAPQLHITAQANLVQLEVVVRDSRGHAVGGLKQTDFEVLDEGKPREIAAFSLVARDAPQSSAGGGAAVSPDKFAIGGTAPAAAPPAIPTRSTLLFFDDLHESAADLQRTQMAAKRFIQEGMGTGARAAVFASAKGLMLDFTADADALTAAIGKLSSHVRLSENGLQPCPHITPYQAYLIDNNGSLDALNAAVQESQACVNADTSKPITGRPTGLGSLSKGGGGNSPTVIAVKAQAAATWEQARNDAIASFDPINDALTLLSKAPGTRVLLMVSSGFLTGMMDRYRDVVIDRAIKSGIVINAIDGKGLWSELPSRRSETVGTLPIQTFLFEEASINSRQDAVNEVMQVFASGTGGLFFHNSNDLGGGFAQLGAVPETTYLIGFKPDANGPAGQYRKLKVKVTARSGDYVQTRPGYTTPANTPAAAPVEPRPIDQQVLASDALTAFPIAVSGRNGKTAKGDPVLSVLIHVDLATLQFTPKDARQAQHLTFIGALLDGSGNIVTAKEGAMDLSLKDDTFARLSKDGVNAGLSFTAPPGAYHVRVVVEDAQGKLAAQTQAVEIPK